MTSALSLVMGATAEIELDQTLEQVPLWSTSRDVDQEAYPRVYMITFRVEEADTADFDTHYRPLSP